MVGSGPELQSGCTLMYTPTRMSLSETPFAVRSTVCADTGVGRSSEEAQGH